VELRAAAARGAEPETDLDSLDRRDREERAADARGQSLGTALVAPQAGRKTHRAHFEHAAERIPGLASGVDRGAHAALGGGVEAHELARVAQARARLARTRERAIHGGLRDRRAADLEHVREHLDAEALEHLPRDRRDRDACGGLARARALEDGARIAVSLLLAAGEVGVSGTRIRRNRELLDRRVAIDDRERDRGPECQARAGPGEELDLVALDLHAPAATVAGLAAREFAVHARQIERETGRQPLDDADERLAVRFAGGRPAQAAQARPPGELAPRQASTFARRRGMSKGFASVPTTPGSAASSAAASRST